MYACPFVSSLSVLYAEMKNKNDKSWAESLRPSLEKKCFWQIESSFVVLCRLDKWCFRWNFHTKHNLYSPQFDSTFISCQQPTLIHIGRLHHQSSCSAGEGLLTLFSETIYSLQTATHAYPLQHPYSMNQRGHWTPDTVSLPLFCEFKHNSQCLHLYTLFLSCTESFMSTECENVNILLQT